MSTNEHTEIDMTEALAQRVRAGESIYVTGPMSEAAGKMHVALVNRLCETTGMPVHVIHS
jgi:hypothetical protein